MKSCYLMRSPVEHKTIGEQKTEDTNPTALSDKTRVLWTTSLLSWLLISFYKCFSIQSSTTNTMVYVYVGCRILEEKKILSKL
ncbi:MAG: hypothetical protein AAFY76_22680 [Cyanobacteria bacterium J06649_11]